MSTGVQEILLKLPDHKLRLADALRGILVSSAPGIEEKIKWGRITFSTTTQDIAFLCCKKENSYIELGFFKAASLTDPRNLFHGKGKDVQRIKISSLDAIPAEQITAWVREAIRLSNG